MKRIYPIEYIFSRSNYIDVFLKLWSHTNYSSKWEILKFKKNSVKLEYNLIVNFSSESHDEILGIR